MDSILIILKKKWPKGFICPYTWTIFYNICIYSRSQVSVYMTIGPLVGFLMTWLFLFQFIRNPGSVADRRNIICDLVCVSLITPLTVATSYLCVSGAMNYYVKDSWERTGLLLLSGVLMGLYLLWLMVGLFI